MKKSTGERLRELREKAGLSPEKLGAKAGISGAYIRKIEKGERKTVTLATAKKLADALNVTSRNFMEVDTGKAKLPSPEVLLSQLQETIRRQAIEDCVKGGLIQDMQEQIETNAEDVEFVPIVGCIPCGLPDLVEEHEADEYQVVSREALKGSKRAFAVKVSGDSLSGDGINHGDILIFDRDAPLVEGKIFAVRLDDGTVTAKHVIHVNKQVILRASNTAYADILITKGQVMGRLIASERQF